MEDKISLQHSQLPNDLGKIKNITPIDLLVYTTIKFFTNKDTKECFPSIARIQEWTGLGKYAMLDLVSSGAKIIMGCRSEVKAKEAIISLTEEQKKQVDFIRLDLCDFQSIVSFVKQIKEKYPKIDILMNNAGAQPTKFNVTKDGFESFIQGNYLGMALLSNLLLKHFNENEGKIINVSSIAHFWSDLNESNYDVLLDNSIGLIKRQKEINAFGKNEDERDMNGSLSCEQFRMKDYGGKYNLYDISMVLQNRINTINDLIADVKQKKESLINYLAVLKLEYGMVK